MTKSSIDQVVIVGPIAVPGQPALGGFQSSNLRLAGVIAGQFGDVSFLRYPDIIGSLGEKLRLYGTVFPKIALSLLLGKGNGSVVHFTPLCRHFLPFELVIALSAKLRGFALVVDIRAGSRINHYRNRSSFYRWMFRTLLKMADAIGYEGQPYGPFIKNIVGNDQAEWLPNFVPAEILNRRVMTQNALGPNLVYVGRLSREKGVAAALAAFKALRELCQDATLTLIGAWDPQFERWIDPALLTLEGLTIAGSLSEKSVLGKLDQAHFFTFLSHFEGEGHSNALTEAMARGCVPVATRHGFSEAVVGAAGLLIEDRDDAKAIAGQIARIWKDGKWAGLSQAATDRVEANFSDRAVASTIAKLYTKATTKD